MGVQKRSKLFHALLLTPFNFADTFPYPDEADDDDEYDDAGLALRICTFWGNLI